MDDIYQTGVFRLVELKDFPNAEQYYDRIETLDTLVAFGWSAPLEDACLRFVDLIVWKRPNTVLTDEAFDELIELWKEEIISTAGHNGARYNLTQALHSLDSKNPLPQLQSQALVQV